MLTECESLKYKKMSTGKGRKRMCFEGKWSKFPESGESFRILADISTGWWEVAITALIQLFTHWFPWKPPHPSDMSSKMLTVHLGQYSFLSLWFSPQHCVPAALGTASSAFCQQEVHLARRVTYNWLVVSLQTDSLLKKKQGNDDTSYVAPLMSIRGHRSSGYSSITSCPTSCGHSRVFCLSEMLS